jgi:hypothetical protein
MIDPRLGDRATGVELQINELVDRRDRLRHEGWVDDATALDHDIADLQLELAGLAEQLTVDGEAPVTVHTTRAVERLAS